jgi:hypothetical protein
VRWHYTSIVAANGATPESGVPECANCDDVPLEAAEPQPKNRGRIGARLDHPPALPDPEDLAGVARRGAALIYSHLPVNQHV